MRDQPIHGMDNFYVAYFLKYWLKNVFSGILSIQCKIRRDRPIGHHWSISVFKLYLFWLEFWTFSLKFYTDNLCYKTVCVCSFCKQHSFTIFMPWSTLSVTNFIFPILPIDWMLELFCHYLNQIGWIGHMTRTISFD